MTAGVTAAIWAAVKTRGPSPLLSSQLGLDVCLALVLTAKARRGHSSPKLNKKEQTASNSSPVISCYVLL